MAKKKQSQIPPPVHRGTCISRCTYQDAFDHDPDVKCSGVFWSNGTMTGGCGDPCSFVMRKAGAGEPPFLHNDDLVAEIMKVLLRKSRSTVAEI